MRLDTLAVQTSYQVRYDEIPPLKIGSASIVPLLDIQGINKAALIIKTWIFRGPQGGHIRPVTGWAGHCDRHEQLEQEVVQHWMTA